MYCCFCDVQTHIYIYQTSWTMFASPSPPMYWLVHQQTAHLTTRSVDLKHSRVALWSHQSAQTASSELSIMQTVNVYICFCDVLEN